MSHGSARCSFRARPRLRAAGTVAWLVAAGLLGAGIDAPSDVLASDAGATQGSPEYRLKAAFLYNFAKFVRWPASAFAESDEIVVGILGEDPFGTVLEDTLEGMTVEGRRFRVVRLRSLEGAVDTHILFVAASERDRIDRIIELVDGRPVLTVSEVPRFAHRGGVINFFIDRDKIRFEINYARSQSVGLEISSRLLGLARIVDEDTRS